MGNWSVLVDVEILSDHQYIEFTINGLRTRINGSNNSIHKRWNFKKLDYELFSETLGFLTNVNIPEELVQDPEKYAEWLVNIINSACNVSAPLVLRKIKDDRLTGGRKKLPATELCD